MMRQVVLYSILIIASGLSSAANAKETKPIKESRGTREEPPMKIYTFNPNQPSARPAVVVVGSEAKPVVAPALLINVPATGRASARPVILDKATPKD